MTYQAPLPNTGAILPVLGSGQAWEGSVYNGNFTGVDAAIGADRARLTTIEGKLVGNGLVPAGTTAARDGLYGVPSNAAARVALANSGARWFNTDNGYQERYFSPAADAGAVAWNSSKAGGWAPADAPANLPFIDLSFPTTSKTWAELTLGVAASTAAYTEVSDIWGWHDPATNPDRIIPKVAGVYEVNLEASIPTNGGFIRALKNGGTITTGGGGSSSTGLGTGPTTGRYTNLLMNGTTDYVSVNVYGANAVINVTAHVVMRYIGPDRSN